MLASSLFDYTYEYAGNICSASYYTELPSCKKFMLSLNSSYWNSALKDLQSPVVGVLFVNKVQQVLSP